MESKSDQPTSGNTQVDPEEPSSSAPGPSHSMASASERAPASDTARSRTGSMPDLGMSWLESMAWASFLPPAAHASESIEEATPAGPVQSGSPVPGLSRNVPSASDDTSAGSPGTMPIGPVEPSSSDLGSAQSFASGTGNLSAGSTQVGPPEHSPQAASHLMGSDEAAQAQTPPGGLASGTAVPRPWNQVNGFARQPLRRWRPYPPLGAARPSIGATDEAQEGITLLGVSAWVQAVRGCTLFITRQPWLTSP